MASSRTLGKGRVLGAGKPSSPAPPIPNSTSPAVKPSSPAIPEHVRNTVLLSPSGSSLSLDSQGSTSKSSLEENDISAVVALHARDNVAAASASSRLVCPICNEDMVTLLQLNRHLDDDHKNLEVIEQDEVKTWFKTQMVKAKKFQPLAVINQKLKGLDVFESNDEQRPASAPPSIQAASEPARPEVSKSESTRPNPDDVVTREHWQRYTQNNACSDPMCGRRLGGTHGSVNCRKCGKLFCDEHTMYQMKLSRSAQHEPVRGYWCRVCETCYKSREGYNDHSGRERDHMKEFTAIRRKAVDSSYLEVSRLEKRLTKLTQILSDPSLQQEQGVVGYFRSFSGTPNQKRLLEQSVVDWEDDARVLQCPFCRQDFTNYTFRRHHCRTCGRVVCADLETGCSSEVGLNVAKPTVALSEKGNAQVSVDVRMCKDCKYLVFSKSDFARELAFEPPDQRAYQNLKQFERGIRMMLPRFQKLLSILQDSDKSPTSAQLTEATKVRKRLTDSFTQYSIAATRIRDLPTNSSTQSRLQQQIYIQASSFLHLHMLPLKSLPKILKHASPHGTAHHPSATYTTPDGRLTPNPISNGSNRLAAIRRTSGAADTSSASSTSAISELETEERELRERLIVLEEQRFLVGEMLADAQRRRKVDEAESLGRNLEDLVREIDGVQSKLGGLDFEAAYVGAGVAGVGKR